MKIERAQTAFITGAGGGIGRALAVALASKGLQVTIIDLKAEEGEKSVRLVEEEHAKISYNPNNNSPSALFIRCDITNTDELAAAFARHQEVFGRLDICINNAGIGNGPEPFYENDTWRKIIEVNLVAVIDGTSKAIQVMRGQGGGLILNVASAAGFVPQLIAPVYGASKGGVAMFTRSLAKLGMGIRVNALCPEYVETPLLHEVPNEFHDFLREKVGFVAMERVIEAAFSMLDDETTSGECVWIPANKPTQIWPDDDVKRKYSGQMKDGSIVNL